MFSGAPSGVAILISARVTPSTTRHDATKIPGPLMTVRAYAPASLGGLVTRVLLTAAQAANTVAQDSGINIRIARLRTKALMATLPRPGNAPSPIITGPPRYSTAKAKITTYF